VAEGIEVVRTALAAGCVPESIYVASEGMPSPSPSPVHGGQIAAGTSPSRLDGGRSDRSAPVDAVAALLARADEMGARIFELAPGVMARVADTVTPQPVMAVFPMVHVPAVPAASRLVVVMVDVRDPGNAGTVLRTADAAGVDAVVCCGGTVDPYNPKTVRSSAGSVFHVPLVLGEDAVAVLEALAPAGGRGNDAAARGRNEPSGGTARPDGAAPHVTGMRRLGAVVRGGTDYATIDWTEPTALVLGNEATGLPATLPLDGTVCIPMAGRAESLNVGMACAVLCFEALRQRRSTIRG
jgi:TrmH family RNA methyltransferase